MRRPTCAIAALAVISALAALAGCAIEPTQARSVREAPTGVAPGVTLYFVDDNGALTPQLRETTRLGTVSEAVSLLLTGPGESGLHTGIRSVTPLSVQQLPGTGTIALRLPLASDEVTRVGIDQIVCTAIATHIQAGGSPSVTVTLHFTIAEPRADEPRRCPVLGMNR